MILVCMGAYPGSNSIRLYRSCYIDPLKWGTWVLTREGHLPLRLSDLVYKNNFFLVGYFLWLCELVEALAWLED